MEVVAEEGRVRRGTGIFPARDAGNKKYSAIGFIVRGSFASAKSTASSPNFWCNRTAIQNCPAATSKKAAHVNARPDGAMQGGKIFAQVAFAKRFIRGSRAVFGDVNRQLKFAVQISEDFLKAFGVTFHHVFADEAEILQTFHRRAAGGDHGVEMMEADAPVIIQADEGGGAPPPAAEKGIQHKFVERVVAAERGRAVPRRIFFIRVKKRPVLGDADFRFTARVAIAADDAAGLHMRPRHVGDDFTELRELPLALRRGSRPADTPRKHRCPAH